MVWAKEFKEVELCLTYYQNIAKRLTQSRNNYDNNGFAPVDNRVFENLRIIWPAIVITNCMKDWKLESNPRGRTLAGEKVQRSILQRESLLRQLFGMPHNHLLRNCTGDVRLFQNHWKRLNTLRIRYMKKWKTTGDYHTNIKNIQPGYRNGIWHLKMWHWENR